MATSYASPIVMSICSFDITESPRSIHNPYVLRECQNPCKLLIILCAIHSVSSTATLFYGKERKDLPIVRLSANSRARPRAGAWNEHRISLKAAPRVPGGERRGWTGICLTVDQV